MAGFIKGLPITWRGDRHPGPVPSIQKLDGRVDCIGYVLHAGGPGLGLVAYSAPAPNGAVLGYHLTGYGLQAVLTAAPIEQGAVLRGLSLPDVTSAHVAAALRAFVECEDAEEAWREAAGVPADRPAPADRRR